MFEQIALPILEIVLTVCMVNDPSQCKQEKIPYEGFTMSCMRDGQPTAVEWIKTHPKWKLARWRCRTPEVET